MRKACLKQLPRGGDLHGLQFWLKYANPSKVSSNLLLRVHPEVATHECIVELTKFGLSAKQAIQFADKKNIPLSDRLRATLIQQIMTEAMRCDSAIQQDLLSGNVDPNNCVIEPSIPKRGRAKSI
jgi:hypothetical protein